MKRFHYREGLVLQIASPDGQFGYVSAVDHYPTFGTLFTIFDAVFDTPLASSGLVRRNVSTRLRQVVARNSERPMRGRGERERGTLSPEPPGI